MQIIIYSQSQNAIERAFEISKAMILGPYSQKGPILDLNEKCGFQSLKWLRFYDFNNLAKL